MARTQLTLQQKKQYIDDWQASGLTQRQYCTHNQLNYSTFHNWKIQVYKTATNTQTLIPVSICDENNLTAITITLRSGDVLQCLPTQLMTVLAALKSC